MRLLVECPECHRQYDASRRPVGSRFRCHCGHLIEVRQPPGHEARVVRCSACGAARPEGADQCAYCGAAFTLHERDLDTVCPHCLALVGDQAKFCHHCGTPLAPEGDIGAETAMACPACQNGHRLANRKVGTDGVAVLECGRCAGFWLGHDAFRRLVERAQRDSLPPGATVETPQQVAAEFGLPSGAAAPGGRRGSFYRPRPVCHDLMVRRNYAHESGVIIDLCRFHGVWFDADELARILVWLRAGGGRQPTPPPDPDRRAVGARPRHEGFVVDDSPDFLRLVFSLLSGWHRWPW
ncbi:MAG: zf-TFIIB domain-containing protein [Zavarzinella sp.]|nr:zf-TFIIB domain-containing protein [Zavarzinella sp.]